MRIRPDPSGNTSHAKRLDIDYVIKTRGGGAQFGKSVQVPESVLRALSNILGYCRAWDQFREKVNNLAHVIKNQHQSVSKRDVSEVETEARAGLDLVEKATVRCDIPLICR